MPSGFKIADAYVAVTLNKDQLRSDLASLPAELNNDVDAAGRDAGTRLGKSLGDGADGGAVGRRVAQDVGDALDPEMDRRGNDSGDKLSQGMQLAMVRNSPMIAAAVGGALIAGAPVVLAGAGVLFAGIAAAAVHSNDQVQSAFDNLKNTITTTFTNAAAVTVPMFVNAMSRISDAVVELGPQFSVAFQALGPIIDSLTTGIINMAENAMPGLVQAVQAAGPVFDGLATLMGDIGTGLGDFFSIIAQHAPAAGQVFAALGSVVQSLLPILAQLVSAGAELAATVLPPIAAAVRVVADALNVLSPILPAVLAGFLAWKGISAVSGYLTQVGKDASNLQRILASTTSAVPGLAGALPVLGAAVGAVAAGYEQASQQINKWAQALLDGGNAARQANSQMQQSANFAAEFGTGIQGVIGRLTGYSGALSLAAGATKQAQDAAKALYDAMSPLEQKQQDVTKATNDLELKMQEYGKNSLQANEASETLRQKQEALTQAQNDLDMATHGVTQAMLDMANQALAAADSGLAYRQAEVQAADAAKAFQQALASGQSQLNDNSAASLAYEQALLRQAEAAGKAAADASGLTDKMDLQKVSDQAVLAELLNLRAEYGSNFPASLEATIEKLQATGVQLDQVGAKKPTPTLDLNTSPFDVKAQAADGSMNNLSGQRPTPIANLDTSPLQTQTNFSLGQLYNLGAQRPTPIATLIAQGLQEAENAIDYVARPRSVALNTYVASTNGGPAAAGSPGAIGGSIADIASRPLKRFADGGSIGGEIFGPGGPTDDMVRAISESGAMLALSNREWVIQASSADKYGRRAMQAINDGTAVITVPTSSDRSVTNTTTTGGNNYTITINITGVDFGDRNFTDRIAAPVRDAIVRLERSRQ